MRGLHRWATLAFVCMGCLQLWGSAVSVAAHSQWPWWYVLPRIAMSAMSFYIALQLIMLPRPFPVWVRAMSLGALVSLQLAAVVVEAQRFPSMPLLQWVYALNLGLSILLIPVVLFVAATFEKRRKGTVV